MATLSKDPRTTTVTLASATAGPFAMSFRLFSDDGITVYVNGAKRTDWTLSATFVNGFDDAASITFNAALAIGDVVIIDSDYYPQRQDDYVNGPDLTERMNVEEAHQWAAIADLRNQVQRSVKTFSALDPITMEASKLLVVNSAGTAIELGKTEAEMADDAAAAAAAAVGVTPFSSRSTAMAANIPASVGTIWVQTPSGIVLTYSLDASGTALTTDSGTKNWSPAGPITPQHWAENTTPGTTDMTSAVQAAIDFAAARNASAQVATAGYKTEVDGLGEILAISDQGARGLSFGGLTGVMLKNCELAAIGSWAAGNPVVDMFNSGGIATHCGLSNVSIKCGHVAPGGVRFDDVQRCDAFEVLVHGMTEYGFRSATTSGALQLTRCEAMQFYFGETGWDIEASRTAKGFDMNTADFIMSDCLAYYCDIPFYKGPTIGTFQMANCHFFNGGLSAAGSQTYNMVIDGPAGGMINNLYNDNGCIKITADDLAQSNGNALSLVNVHHVSTAADTATSRIEITTSVAGNDLAGLTLANHRFKNGEAANIDFQTTGGGSYADPLEWNIIGSAQRDGTNISTSGDPVGFNFNAHFRYDGQGTFGIGRFANTVFESDKSISFMADADNNTGAGESYVSLGCDGTEHLHLYAGGTLGLFYGQATSGADVGQIAKNGDNISIIPNDGAGSSLSAESLQFDVSGTRWRIGTDNNRLLLTQVTSGTVASLPAASAVPAGSRGWVTDATQTVAAGHGTTVAGGGGNSVPVYSTGSVWRIG